VRSTHGGATIIPHGIDALFLTPPREQLPLSHYSIDSPMRLLYVSIIDMYKHQWHVAEAVALLRRRGFPVALDMVGPAYPPALKRLQAALKRLDPEGAFLHYCGPVPHSALPARYAQAHICIFASSCENMPNILLEGMASGLPIACSNRGPMPEVLGDAGVYFNPENAAEIASVLHCLIDSPEQRTRLARMAFERVRTYSWGRCADETLSFLAASATRGASAAGFESVSVTMSD